MSQEYTVKNWKAWVKDGDKVTDNYGNHKGSVTFEGVGEPVDATFKDEPQIGDKKYGDVVEYTTKAGGARQKFKRAERPQEQQDSRQNHIRAQWAIGQAVQIAIATGSPEAFKGIEGEARTFYAMVDRIREVTETERKQIEEGFKPEDIPF